MSVTERALMVGESLVTFGQTLIEQDRQDMLDLMVYAEMHATSKADQQGSPYEWLSFYQRALLQHGCKIMSFVADDTFEAFTVEQVRRFELRVASKDKDDIFVQMVKQGLAAFKLEEKVARHLLQSFVPQRESPKAVLCSVNPCYLDEQNRAFLGICGLVLSYEVQVRQGLLTDTYTQYVTLSPTGGRYLFDREVYATHREQVHEQTDLYFDRLIRPVDPSLLPGAATAPSSP